MASTRFEVSSVSSGISHEFEAKDASKEIMIALDKDTSFRCSGLVHKGSSVVDTVNGYNEDDDDDDDDDDDLRDNATRRASLSKKFMSLVGNPGTFTRTENERREKRKQMTYEPTHRWWEPPIQAWVPQCNREILIILLVYNVVVVLLARYTDLCGHPEPSDDGQIFCGEEWILLEDKALVGFAVGMFLLLAFRANQAYDRWWEGRKLWGRMREVCRDFSRLVCNHVEVKTRADKADRRRAIDFLTAFAVALKLQLRDERHIVKDLTDKDNSIGNRLSLTMQDIANIQQAGHMPNFCMDILSDYLAKQYRQGNLTDYQLGTINQTVLAVLSDNLGGCERLRNTPIPLSYVLQLRFFLILWLVLYPLHVVAFYGWYTALLASLVSYAVLGIESMASEIENPFGYDRNDLDLDKFCQGFCGDTQDILDRHESEDCDLLFDRKKITALNKSRSVVFSNASGIGSSSATCSKQATDTADDNLPAMVTATYNA